MQLPERFTRRQLLGLAAAGAATAAWPVEEAGAGPKAVASGAVTCVLSPELTEGPYYLRDEAVRRDITEGKPGTPLRLHLTVVSAASCKPLKHAAVDVWHADAGGVYSGVAGAGGTFLRGVQKTDHKGLAVFDTIYPGWYRGRAVHIHVKVHLSGSVVHTGQLFFPDALNNKVYANAPYSSRGTPDIADAADSIYRNGGSRSLLHVTKSGAGYLGSIVMGVHTG
jgi:protocatechuate 3,4-dioxygenase beta subunit